MPKQPIQPLLVNNEIVGIYIYIDVNKNNWLERIIFYIHEWEVREEVNWVGAVQKTITTLRNSN